MKRLITALLASIIALSTNLYAWEYAERENIDQTNGQIRFNFNYSLALPKNFGFELAEELRLDMIPFSAATVFDYSLTTVAFSYTPIKYVKLDLGYILKIPGAATKQSASTHWSNPNNYLKHRFYASVIGNYGWNNCKITLRERLVSDIRFDDFDPITTNQNLLTLRHYLGFTYSIPAEYIPLLRSDNVSTKSISPYIWTEPANSLNANQYTCINNLQYLERWCSAIGVKWEINTVTLNFYYRMDFTQSVSATLSGNPDNLIVNQKITKKYEHIFGVGLEI